MSDRHTTSTSDELLGKARSATSSSEPATYQPESPVDDYRMSTPFDARSVAPDVPSDPDVDDLSAEEIAAALLESTSHAGSIATPSTDAAPAPEVDAADQGASSLPGWATEPASAAPQPLASSVEVPGPRTADAMRDEGPGEAPTTRTPTPNPDPMWAGGERWDEPTNEWLEYEARQKAKKQALGGNIPIPRIRTIVALVVAGFFLFSLVYGFVDAKEPIETATVGDCFTAGDALEIDQVAIVDCAEEHDSEVFAIVDATPVFGTSYPGEDQLFDWLFDECLEAFPGYTGESYQTSRYYFDTLIPTSDAWRFGDHEGMCTLILLDDDSNLLISTSSGRHDAPDTDNA